MNQCSLHSSSNAAVLLGEPVKGFDGLGVSQHDCDLPPLLTVGRLALSAGLGLHGLAQQGAKRGRHRNRQLVRIAGVLHGCFRRKAAELAGLGPGSLGGNAAEVRSRGAIAVGDGFNVNLAASHLDHAGGDFGWGEVGAHGFLPSGQSRPCANPTPSLVTRQLPSVGWKAERTNLLEAA